MDYQSDIQIDKYKLHIECEKHSAIFLDYCKKLVEAKEKRDSEKIKLSVMQGDKELFYRKNPPENLKITDSVIKALLSGDKELIAQSKKVIQCETQVQLLDVAIRSFEHRKAMLNNLVQLWTTGYYAKPDTTGNARNKNNNEAQLRIRRGLRKKGDS